MGIVVKYLTLLGTACLIAGGIVYFATLEPEPEPEKVRFKFGKKIDPADDILSGPVPSFSSQIEPILAEHCLECHSSELAEAELRLDSLEGMLKGGKSGAAVVPGKTVSSLLVTAINYHDSTLHMPPDRRLPKREINLLTHWIDNGAPHPDSSETPTPTEHALADNIDWEAGRKHWAFQPPVKPSLPEVERADWLKTPVDAFILKEHQERGLEVVPTADKRTLLRRVTFDLTGLPPTPEDLDSFLNDDSPDAYEKRVERLLASPQYGERWGRHWLDIARYSDSNGHDENLAYANAWRYRDYVVESFNQGKPYDQFLHEQLAGDLLAAELTAEQDLARKHELLIATGYLALGPKSLGEVDPVKLKMDLVDEQLDTLGRSLMGLTLGCARCHDHKFDPISNSDYYALAGIFNSTRTMERTKKGPDQNELSLWFENPIHNPAEQLIAQQHEDRKTALKEKYDHIIENATADLKKRLEEVSEKLGVPQEFPENPSPRFSYAFQNQLKELEEDLGKLNQAEPQLPSALGVTEGKIKELAIHIRGSHLTLGEMVPRRIPEIFSGNKTTPPSFNNETSGRLQFAEWLTDQAHPLTARIMVNRLWRWHFGQGLVKTTDNFGLQGEAPSNQDLLDWLACEFVEQDYSIKAVHRLILLSHTYQLGGNFHEQNAVIDPENRYHWRYQGRRLEAEAIRDAILAVSGSLDRQIGGVLLETENRDFVADQESNESVNYDTPRRSLYLPIIRNHLYPVFELFDYTNASALNGDRPTSTAPTQALFLMNSPLMDQSASALAEEILKEEADQSTRIKLIYQKAYGRPASLQEIEKATRYLESFQTEFPEDTAESKQLAWQTLCHALLASNEFTFIK